MINENGLGTVEYVSGELQSKVNSRFTNLGDFNYSIDTDNVLEEVILKVFLVSDTSKYVDLKLLCDAVNLKPVEIHNTIHGGESFITADEDATADMIIEAGFRVLELTVKDYINKGIKVI